MKLYNTLTRKKDKFVPIDDNNIGIYACGPTVYDYIHIGNARMLVVVDTLRRFLEFKGYNVIFIQNFTDIDDKMIKRANEEGITVKELADRFIKEYFIDADGLGVKRATLHPRATEHINPMIELIKKLIDKKIAYAVDGDVYFDTGKFKNYGKLSQQNIKELEAGLRVEVTDKKRNPMDFVLWKSKKEGEPSWTSPWGEGRPGWHIECSAMAIKYLGETIDIHAGGQDLIFPHHENEIAQSEAATGRLFARYWVHNGFLNIDNQKMSKSLGNYHTVRDISKEFDYQTIRFCLLSVHYRNPMNFSRDLMLQAKSALERLYNCWDNLIYFSRNSQDKVAANLEDLLMDNINKYKDEFIFALENDLNTADAIACLFEIVREVNISINQNSSKKAIDFCINTIQEISSILGLLQQKENVNLEKEVEDLIEKRQQARKDKDWELADRIRQQLKERGIIIEDTPQGVRWKKEH